MEYLSIAMWALGAVVGGGFLLALGLGYLMGRYEDCGPGDPPLINRGDE